ncbi:MAG: hypothetical protein RMI91_04085 [Gemmatales bacterium]|nr:carboxypeptidase-like regulatory domain-containing protein [Gemmatales bacterium]MDW7993813.1 hypothetical protein [Gemmatales bacterium]
MRCNWLRGSVIFLLMPLACQRVVYLPQTQEMRGYVSYSDGRPLTGGAVEFRNLRDPTIRAVAEIQRDGSFDLNTLAADRKLQGIPPGRYEVIISPPLETSQTISPYKLPQPVEIAQNQNEVRLVIEGFPSNSGGPPGRP